MPVVATILSMAILLQAGSYPTQLLFHIPQEKMIAENPPARHAVLGLLDAVVNSFPGGLYDIVLQVKSNRVHTCTILELEWLLDNYML